MCRSKLIILQPLGMKLRWIGFSPWSTAGGDYTTVSSGQTSTIPVGGIGWRSIDLKAPFLARYPASMAEFLNQGFLLKYSTAPGSGEKLTFTSKEYTTTSLRWNIEVTYAVVQSITIYPTDTKLYHPRERVVTATINPPVSGVTLNLYVRDPDDPADDPLIDGSSVDNDNKDGGVAGQITFTVSGNSIDERDELITGTTNASGQVIGTFVANNKYGGNNYKIEAKVSGTSVFSPEMVV